MEKSWYNDHFIQRKKIDIFVTNEENILIDNFIELFKKNNIDFKYAKEDRKDVLNEWYVGYIWLNWWLNKDNWIEIRLFKPWNESNIILKCYCKNENPKTWNAPFKRYLKEKLINILEDKFWINKILEINWNNI